MDSSSISAFGIPPIMLAYISHDSAFSEESTYLGMFRLYSFARISDLLTTFEYLSIFFLDIYVSTIRFISDA